jgi:DNA-binding MarR family transcriptional regulator
MVRMTDAGRAAIERAAPGHVAATRRYFFDQLSDREVDLLTSMFDRVLANLEREASVDRRGADGQAGQKPRR